jgi:hypothetical protein
MLGLAGTFGVRTAETTVRGAGYELTITYASVTRPGLATPWAAEIRRPGGFEGPVNLAVSAPYLEMFDENGLDPDPAAATADARFVVWEFDRPPGESLNVSFDARLEPGVQWGKEGSAQLLVDGRVVLEVSFRTWVMP